jgi:hypothetical protein
LARQIRRYQKVQNPPTSSCKNPYNTFIENLAMTSYRQRQGEVDVIKNIRLLLVAKKHVPNVVAILIHTFWS